MRTVRTTGVIGSALHRATTLALAVLLGAGALALADNGSRGTSSAQAYPVGARALAVKGIRIVQANIRSGMSADRIAADLERVYTETPDFITYNEVPGVPDELLAASGYAIQRTPGTYTGATPVVWNTQRFTRLNSGTHLISNRRVKGPDQKIYWGVRYANWVTVRDTATGQVLSVISAHFAPVTEYTPVSLRTTSYTNLGTLVNQLSPSGPVFAAGDFNVDPRAGDYPRSVVDGYGFRTNWEQTGQYLGTYYGHGATIDHVYAQGTVAAGLPIAQSVTTMNSDHRMLTVDIGNVVDGPSVFPPGWLVSDPVTAPLVTTRLIAKVLYRAPKGAVMHLYSQYLDSPRIWRAIKRAKARGVYVQVITSTLRTTAMDRRLAALLGTNLRRRSWAVRQPHWERYGLPLAGILASSSGGTPAVRIDLSRPLTVKAIRKPVRARTKTNRFAYDRLFIRYFRAVGRNI